jgi:branched-chain amino acid transport system substrate-binding protein
MSKNKETTVLLLTLLITVAAIAGGLWWFNGTKQKLLITDQNRDAIVPNKNTPLPKISAGNEILINQDATLEKASGSKAIAEKSYPQAESYFEQSLSKKRNDPEALIYLNNARIGDNQAYTIAVPVPIGTEITTAEEILRGVAQAQNEINQQGGINGVPLKIVIADDDNNPDTAKQLAQDLTQNQDILGVVGHFSSGVTLATADIYQDQGLVAISPTSTSVDISNLGSYIFRTVPSDRFTSNALAEYALEQLNKPQAIVIYNSQSPYSVSLKDSFTTDMVNSGGEVASEVDLAQSNFNPADILQQFQNREAEVLVFLNDSQTVDKAYLLMQLNNNQLSMLAGNSLYKPQTLQVVGAKAVGLVLAVPWHVLGNNNSDFPEASRSLWGGDVNWRSAMAYDAVQALAAGLKADPSREGIQKTLSQSNFVFNGASGTVKFLLSGDRNSPVQLVTVQSGKRSPYGYDFVPLK